MASWGRNRVGRIDSQSGDAVSGYNGVADSAGKGLLDGIAVATLFSMMTFVLHSLSDPFNWGWNLLGMAGSRWHILWSPAIPWIQVICVLIGAGYAVRALYRRWRDGASMRQRAIWGSLPLASFLWASAAGMICFSRVSNERTERQGGLETKVAGEKAILDAAELRILAVMLGVPLLVLLYRSHPSGLSITQMCAHI